MVDPTSRVLMGQQSHHHVTPRDSWWRSLDKLDVYEDLVGLPRIVLLRETNTLQTQNKGECKELRQIVFLTRIRTL